MQPLTRTNRSARATLIGFGAAILVLSVSGTTQAQPLTVVSVSAPQINCVFDPSCKVVVSDTSSPIALNGAAGKGFLQSRTYTGKPGAPGSGKRVYVYRIDLRASVGIVNIPCVSALTIPFGAVVGNLDYNKNGTPDQVFVITKGGLGSVGPKTATLAGDNVTFGFNPPVCAGGSPGNGQSSYFFGLAANTDPKFVTATLAQTTGPSLSLQARAPITGLKKPLGILPLRKRP